MKILHCCLSCFYIDGAGYQENKLVKAHVALGHEVLVIASTENLNDRRKLDYVEPSSYEGTDSAKVTRLDYTRAIPQVVARKLRIHPGFREVLEEFEPEVIYFHGLCGWELLTVANYKKKHPEVRLVADSHEDRFNSGRNFVSLHLLHRLYYRAIIRKALGNFDSVYCISQDVHDFVVETYGVEANRLEFLPLGGDVHSDSIYLEKREKARDRFGISSDSVWFVQSGKFSGRKKLIESMQLFTRFSPGGSKMLIVGSVSEDLRIDFEECLNADPRIEFAGWLDQEQLDEVLCGADVYLQPGTQSVTMQHSLCCRCAVVVDRVDSHHFYVDGSNGWLIESVGDLEGVYKQIEGDAAVVPAMSEQSRLFALSNLDYRSIAGKVLG